MCRTIGTTTSSPICATPTTTTTAIPDISDPFAVDAANGLSTDVPIEYPFRSDTTGSPCAPTPVAERVSRAVCSAWDSPAS